MCSKFSDRLFIKRNAEKLIFLFAVLTASLVTGIACRHVEAAQRLQFTAAGDKVYNPSACSIWVEAGGKKVEVPGGGMVSL